MDSEMRHLNFNSFINDRAQQIAKFTEVLAQDTRKKGHQSVPKSIRRRAMSHNRYRIPLRIRRPMEQQLAKAQSMQKLPKCRKSIRKKHRLLVSYKMRSDKYKWLATHLWATKRMKMMNYFQYKIAYTPNNKSYRSAYRNFRHNACLIDVSYLNCLKITLNNTLLPQFISIASQQPLKQINQLKFDKIYHGDLRYKEKLICPIKIIHINKQNLICFFDPCCKTQVLQKITINECIQSLQISQSPCQIYKLIGPQSFNRVYQLFKKLRIQSEYFTENGIYNVNYLPRNKIIYHQNTEGKQSSEPIRSSPFPMRIKQGYNPAQNTKIREQLNLLYKKYVMQQVSKGCQQSCNFWQFYEQQYHKNLKNSEAAQNLMIKVTTRSKYTHKRKNKLTKEEKKKVILEDSLKKSYLYIQQQPKDQEQEKQIQNNMLRAPSRQFCVSPIAIALINSENSNTQKSIKNNKYEGCYIFCNSDHNCLIWRTLTHLNVKVIGQRQDKHCQLQSQIRSFPQDYPTTQSYQNYIKQQSILKINKYKRLPTQKRINYSKINSPYPFYTPFVQISQQMKYVKIEMVGRGRCFTGSYICSLDNTDFQTIFNYLQVGGAIKHVTKQQENKQAQKNQLPDYKSDTYEQINLKLKQIADNNKMKRRIIGFVTSGGFIYSKSREGGLGFITNCQYNVQQNNYVLIRKPSSRYYFLGTLIL